MPANVVAVCEPARADCQDVRKDGGLLEVAVTDSPILDPKDRVIGIARIARDTGQQRLLKRNPKEKDMQITKNSVETASGPSDWFTGAVYIDTAGLHQRRTQHTG
jgi:hypothetical protein